MNGLPAILGGTPVFDSPLPFARPTLEDQPRVENLITESLSSGRLTDGPLTRALEEKAAEFQSGGSQIYS